jgi:amino acid adenylation domain-containing protein
MSEYPLSFAQQRLWFLHQMQPSSPHYNVFTNFNFSTDVNEKVLRDALSEIVRRHAVLRTRFVVVDGKPVQKVNSSGFFPLEMKDVRSLDELQRTTEVRRVANEQANLAFDLAKDALARAVLIRLVDNHSVLFITMHHIITDAFSSKIFENELGVIYDAFLLGKPSPLPELSFSYTDFAADQRERLSGDHLAGELAYWRHKLKDLSELRLPVADEPTRNRSNTGRTMRFKIPRPVFNSIRKLGLQHECTVFMTMLAAFKILLFRYTGQEDIVVGCPFSGRFTKGTETLIGFFVNTLVLRSEIVAGDTFETVLEKVRLTTLEAFEHGEVPFDMLVNELHPNRAAGNNPLFQVMFQVTSVGEMPPAPEEELDLRATAAKFDITVSLVEGPDGLHGYVEYNTSRFQPKAIDQFITHFGVLLRSIAASPDTRVADLVIMDREEMERVLLVGTAASVSYPGDQFVHRSIKAAASAYPDHIALRSDSEEMTFEQLESLSNRFSHYLLSAGVKTETLVVVCMNRSLKMVAVHLAILKAAGAFVPMDTAYPRERLEFMIKDTGARFIVTESHLLSQLPALNDMHMVLIDQEQEAIYAMPNDTPQVPLIAENRAYVIYTSGSTGRPKGVELTHGGLMNLVKWNVANYAIVPADCSLQMATPAYDAYIFELFPCLSVGASVFMIDDVSRMSPRLLQKKLLSEDVTLAFLPTALGEKVIAEEWPVTTSLRILGIGGEKLMRMRQDKLPFKSLNYYGPTENTVMSTCYEMLPGGHSDPPPIGKTMANVRSYILDGAMNPVPMGVFGELYLGGSGVGRGYFGHPRLTAGKFVPDPYTTSVGARLYRTGDLVRYLPDGNIDFGSRIDTQVKIRGFRIELEEIERTIYTHPAVKEAVVQVQNHLQGEKVIVAHVCVKEGFELTPEGLKTFLKEKLPSFMLPAFIGFLAELPKTVNGKIDRKSLSFVPQQDQPKPSGNQVAETELEILIANVWKEHLGVDRVSAYDNFFDIGGHSLMMAQVHHQLKERLQTDIALVDLFRYPTISLLAKHFEHTNAFKTIGKPVEDRAVKQRQVFVNMKGGFRASKT